MKGLKINFFLRIIVFFMVTKKKNNTFADEFGVK